MLAEEDEESKKLYEQRLRQLQVEMQKKELLKRMLDEQAYERMMNVRLANPQLYEKVVQTLAYVAQSGGKTVTISDAQLYQMLQKMTQEKETKIEFKRK
jgi:programmed cell death protein 5